MLLDAHVALLVICSAANTFTSSAITNSLTTLLAANYKLIPLHIGLCYLPFTFGGLSSRWTAGTIADWLYRRQAHQIGEDIQPNRQSPEQLERMPLEKARLRLTIPFVYFCCVCIVGYGWVMNYNVHLAGPLILLLLYGNATTGVSSTIAILAVDLNASRPASTHAAMNLVSYLTSAGAVAAVVPLIDNTGVGWMGVIMAGVMIVTSPALWALYIWGKAWREKPSPKTCK
ncbi:MFS general substrate transporter [Penicillium brevicompactum]|uniref:MFS general substrate transporter n=1 Tax=Penicillium brevicompactum TaxID=5074 RepID=A0A9W9UJZ0_PENBR|nr:MFS general substrate transporter [Penicillium brevicompactum]